MGDMDYSKNDNLFRGEDYELLLSHVVCEEPELLFLDTVLKECFAREVN